MRLWNVLLAGALVAGCAKGPELEPAANARTMDGDAVAADAGVQVQVDPSDWYGLDLDAHPELVRLHVSIENNSGRPLHLAYDHFTLVGDNGRTWQAIDPSRPDMVDLHLMDELLERTTLEPVVEGEVETMNDEMAGYVYFRGVDADRVTFQMDLVDASTGTAFGQVAIPFNVDPQPMEQGTTVSDAE